MAEEENFGKVDELLILGREAKVVAGDLFQHEALQGALPVELVNGLPKHVAREDGGAGIVELGGGSEGVAARKGGVIAHPV